MWSPFDPQRSAPEGATPSLNTSESFQTKTGDLNLAKGLTLAADASIKGKCDVDGLACSDASQCAGGHGTKCMLPDFIVEPCPPTGCVPSDQICWNNECKSGGWNANTGTQQTYLPTTTGVGSTGNVYLQGYHTTDPGFASLGIVPPLAGMQFVAGASPDSNNPTNAISAWSFHPGDSIYGSNYYAVYGRAGANSPNNVGVYGMVVFDSSAIAGRFEGNVAVFQTDDLIVGNRLAGDSDGNGELCINNDCRTTWPAASSSDQYWNESSGVLVSGDPTYGISVGGVGAGSPFYLERVVSQDKANFVVNGVGTTGNVLTVE